MIAPVNILLIILWAIIVPYILGSLVTRINGSGKGSMAAAKNISYGFMLMCVIFIVPAIPMILIHVPFHILSITWQAAVCILSVLSIAVALRERKSVSQNGRETEDKVQPYKERKSIVLFVWAAALIVIAFETGLPVLRMHVDTDDARFLVDAMEALKRHAS